MGGGGTVVDHRHMGQSAHPAGGRARWTATWLAAATFAGALTLTGCGTPVAAAPTTLRGVVDATVVHADGSSLRAVTGLRVHRGDVVRTGPAGRAELVTRGRVVYEGSDAAVQVVDGAHQRLRQGAVVIDAQHGPGLALRVASLAVTTPDGAASRAERGVTVRVGTLAGPAVRIVSDSGRELAVRALFQALAGGDALPDSPGPLWLTDDDGEAHAVPTLVRDDEALRALAAGIDSTGTSAARAVAAAWHGPVVAVPRGVARSEQVMPIVLAAAGGPRDAVARYRQAVAWRVAGGSWGVVEHLLGVQTSSAVAALAVFEHTRPAGRVTSVPAVLERLAEAVSPPAGSRPESGAGGHHQRHPGGSSRHGGSSPTPAPSPTPSGPLSSVLNTLTSTLADILSVVPTPSPMPTSPAVVHASPSPSPSPSLPVGGLTSGLAPAPRR
jgi:hypothetical protein